MDATELGQTGLVGWREKAANGIARPASERTGMEENQLRALVGALFFVLAVYYVVGTVKRAIGVFRS